jgi:hypothetical protein
MQENVRTLPISGRIAEADYEFLMSCPMGGKVTASEKLRYVASFFRDYHENMYDFAKCQSELNRLLERFAKEMRAVEHSTAMHSDLMDRLMVFSTEITATLITAKVPEDRGRSVSCLRDLEERVLRLALQVLESILRMALTRESPTYNPQVLREKLNTTIELVELIAMRPTLTVNPQKDTHE